MQAMHGGIAALLGIAGLLARTTATNSSGEGMIEFLSSPHTSLLDLAERNARPFFWPERAGWRAWRAARFAHRRETR